MSFEFPKSLSENQSLVHVQQQDTVPLKTMSYCHSSDMCNTVTEALSTIKFTATWYNQTVAYFKQKAPKWNTYSCK